MGQPDSLMLTLKVITIALLVTSVSVILASAVYSNSFEPFTLSPSSTASASSDTYNPPSNYTLSVTAGNCAIDILSSSDNTIRADLNVTSSFFVKAFARIDVSAVNSTYGITLDTPQYWGINAVANIYIPSGILSHSLSVNVQNGGITADIPRLVDETTLETTNGQIAVRGSSVSDVTTQNTNGNTYISVSSFGTISSSAVNGNVQLTVSNASASGSASLATTNGNVNYLANPASNLSISANTVNGVVSISGLTYDATLSNIRQLVATVNGGGTSVVLSTVNGNVKIGSSLPVMSE